MSNFYYDGYAATAPTTTTTDDDDNNVGNNIKEDNLYHVARIGGETYSRCWIHATAAAIYIYIYIRDFVQPSHGSSVG
jgi:hypothetical protein